MSLFDYFFETREQKQQREYKLSLARKDQEYTEAATRRVAERELARKAGEQAGYICVTYHPGIALNKWQCCGGKLATNVAGGGCEEKWIDAATHST